MSFFLRHRDSEVYISSLDESCVGTRRNRNTACTQRHGIAECDCSSQQCEVHPCKDKEKEGSRDAKSRLGKVGFIRRLTMRP